jgi:putative DNA primase/helicase
MFSWVHPQMEFSPILYVTGPTMECGKTTLLNVIGKMVRRPVKTSNVSAAAVYRLSELYHQTFLMDEAQDQLKNPDFWLVIKSGHGPGEYAIRCEPNTNNPEAFDVFCPKLLAAIGRANGQIMSRSIIIEMERKDGERDRSVKESDPVFVEIRRKLARWANDAGDLSRFQFPAQSHPKMRHRDNWESLYRAVRGVSEFVAQQLLNFIPYFSDEEQDYATYLLNSLRKLYREHGQLTKEGFLGSEAIVNALNQDKEAPWYAKDDRGLNVRALSDRLRRYKVKPDKVWQSEIDKELRGYRYIDSRPRHNDLKRVFDQYLPPEDFK